MSTVRPAAVAGTFYPASSAALGAEVRTHIERAAPPVRGAPRPKALIVPHAGYMYSAAIAAAAYRRLAAGCEAIDTVVLLGPAHRGPLRGLAVPSVDAFATPLGERGNTQATSRDMAEYRAMRHAHLGKSGLRELGEHLIVQQIQRGTQQSPQCLQLLGHTRLPWHVDSVYIVRHSVYLDRFPVYISASIAGEHVYE